MAGAKQIVEGLIGPEDDINRFVFAALPYQLLLPLLRSRIKHRFSPGTTGKIISIEGVGDIGEINYINVNPTDVSVHNFPQPDNNWNVWWATVWIGSGENFQTSTIKKPGSSDVQFGPSDVQYFSNATQAIEALLRAPENEVKLRQAGFFESAQREALVVDKHTNALVQALAQDGWHDLNVGVRQNGQQIYVIGHSTLTHAQKVVESIASASATAGLLTDGIEVVRRASTAPWQADIKVTGVISKPIVADPATPILEAESDDLKSYLAGIAHKQSGAADYERFKALIQLCVADPDVHPQFVFDAPENSSRYLVVPVSRVMLATKPLNHPIATVDLIKKLRAFVDQIDARSADGVEGWATGRGCILTFSWARHVRTHIRYVYNELTDNGHPLGFSTTSGGFAMAVEAEEQPAPNPEDMWNVAKSRTMIQDRENLQKIVDGLTAVGVKVKYFTDRTSVRDRHIDHRFFANLEMTVSVTDLINPSSPEDFTVIDGIIRNVIISSIIDQNPHVLIDWNRKEYGSQHNDRKIRVVYRRHSGNPDLVFTYHHGDKEISYYVYESFMATAWAYRLQRDRQLNESLPQTAWMYRLQRDKQLTESLPQIAWAYRQQKNKQLTESLPQTAWAYRLRRDKEALEESDAPQPADLVGPDVPLRVKLFDLGQTLEKKGYKGLITFHQRSVSSDSWLLVNAWCDETQAVSPLWSYQAYTDVENGVNGYFEGFVTLDQRRNSDHVTCMLSCKQPQTNHQTIINIYFGGKIAEESTKMFHVEHSIDEGIDPGSIDPVYAREGINPEDIIPLNDKIRAKIVTLCETLKREHPDWISGIVRFVSDDAYGLPPMVYYNIQMQDDPEEELNKKYRIHTEIKELLDSLGLTVLRTQSDPGAVYHHNQLGYISVLQGSFAMVPSLDKSTLRFTHSWGDVSGWWGPRNESVSPEELANDPEMKIRAMMYDAVQALLAAGWSGSVSIRHLPYADQPQAPVWKWTFELWIFGPILSSLPGASDTTGYPPVERKIYHTMCDVFKSAGFNAVRTAPFNSRVVRLSPLSPQRIPHLFWDGRAEGPDVGAEMDIRVSMAFGKPFPTETMEGIDPLSILPASDRLRMKVIKACELAQQHPDWIKGAITIATYFRQFQYGSKTRIALVNWKLCLVSQPLPSEVARIEMGMEAVLNAVGLRVLKIFQDADTRTDAKWVTGMFEVATEKQRDIFGFTHHWSNEHLLGEGIDPGDLLLPEDRFRALIHGAVATIMSKGIKRIQIRMFSGRLACATDASRSMAHDIIADADIMMDALRLAGLSIKLAGRPFIGGDVTTTTFVFLQEKPANIPATTPWIRFGDWSDNSEALGEGIDPGDIVSQMPDMRYRQMLSTAVEQFVAKGWSGLVGCHVNTAVSTARGGTTMPDSQPAVELMAVGPGAELKDPHSEGYAWEDSVNNKKVLRWVTGVFKKAGFRGLYTSFDSGAVTTDDGQKGLMWYGLAKGPQLTRKPVRIVIPFGKGIRALGRDAAQESLQEGIDPGELANNPEMLCRAMVHDAITALVEKGYSGLVSVWGPPPAYKPHHNTTLILSYVASTWPSWQQQDTQEFEKNRAFDDFQQAFVAAGFKDVVRSDNSGWLQYSSNPGNRLIWTALAHGPEMLRPSGRVTLEWPFGGFQDVAEAQEEHDIQMDSPLVEPGELYRKSLQNSVQGTLARLHLMAAYLHQSGYTGDIEVAYVPMPDIHHNPDKTRYLHIFRLHPQEYMQKSATIQHGREVLMRAVKAAGITPSQDFDKGKLVTVYNDENEDWAWMYLEELPLGGKTPKRTIQVKF